MGLPFEIKMLKETYCNEQSKFENVGKEIFLTDDRNFSKPLDILLLGIIF